MNTTRGMMCKKGYSLIELVIVIVVLAILAAVAIPTVGNLMTSSKIKATEKEMMELVHAIVGDPEAGILGFVDEMGDLPDNVAALYSIGTSSPYNPFTRTGWNGPYIDMRRKDVDGNGSIGATEYDILYDAWSNDYVYDKAAKTVTSWGPDGGDDGGGDDDIVVDIE